MAYTDVDPLATTTLTQADGNPRRMSEARLRALLSAEKESAMSPTQASTLSMERERAMRYYLGDMQREMPSAEGRSSAISSDVLDTIEGLMPSLMEIFAGGDDVVRFEPVGPDDVQAAQQETDYVNYVFMQQNPGFLILYDFIKDSLLSKNGFIKVWTETETNQQKYTFYDQPEDAYFLIASNPQFQIVAESVKMSPLGPLHDVAVMVGKDIKHHCVACIPPEEVGISRDCTSFDDCGYAYHQTAVAVSDLIAKGYDQDVLRGLSSYSGSSVNLNNAEAAARDTVNESQMYGDGANAANRMVLVVEHYIRMNYEGEGQAGLYCVVTGENNEFLTRNGEIDIREIDAIPMATMSPIPQPHRFWGRSVADVVIELQQIKTALQRAMLDNMYMSVNPRPVVYESNSGPQTLDDLLLMRPGQPIRAKVPGAIEWQEVPNVAAAVLPVMQWLDTLREWRTGVSRQGQGTDPNALQNQVATIANQMYNASQAKVKLIARIFAETGVRDLFSLLHKEIRKYGDQQQTVRLRNQWVTVDPADWKDREDMTINVGLGTGTKAEQLAQLQMLVNAQKEAVQIGLVSPRNFYNSAKELVRLTDRKDVDQFFVMPGAPQNPNDPASQPLPPPPNPDQQKAQVDMVANQQKVQLEQQKAQADVQREAAQAQSEIAIAERKAQLETQLALLNAEIKREQHAMDMAKHAADMQMHDKKMQDGPRASVDVKHDAGQITGPMGDAINALGQHLAAQQGAHTQAILDALAQHSKPKRIRKTADGYVTETVQ